MIYFNVFQIITKGTQPLPLSPESRSLLSPQGKARWFFLQPFFQSLFFLQIYALCCSQQYVYTFIVFHFFRNKQQIISGRTLVIPLKVQNHVGRDNEQQ